GKKSFIDKHFKPSLGYGAFLMKITLVEPFFAGSHKVWAEGLQRHSRHEIELLTLKGNFWKWRMHGGAVTLARQFVEREAPEPDLLLVSDMLDLSTFWALARLGKSKQAIYFHENQLTYPWSPTDPDVKLQRDTHYGFINYVSGLCADQIFFNSHYHQDSFIGALPEFLKRFPDYQEMESVEELKKRSQVLPLGLELRRFERYRHHEKEKEPVILWNHRWEYDKNPEDFFRALFWLEENEIDFKVIVLGQAYQKCPAIFGEARRRLADKILHWGYAESFEEYAYWLWKADILPVTAVQDFFGASTVEAICCNCFPLPPNRLAYAEHIPPAEHDTHFYDSFEDLTFFLEHLILNIDKIRRKQYQHFVTKYDWNTLIRNYDESFERVKEKKGLKGMD
ncbi:MAG: DUF3524 domain-containing protein, partial [Bacteroidota bacterium]